MNEIPTKRNGKARMLGQGKVACQKPKDALMDDGWTMHETKSWVARRKIQRFWVMSQNPAVRTCMQYSSSWQRIILHHAPEGPETIEDKNMQEYALGTRSSWPFLVAPGCISAPWLADEQTWKKAPLQGLHPGPRDSLMIMGERTSGEHGCIQRPINAIIQEMYEQPMGFHATWRFSSLWVMMTYPSFRQSQITRNHIIHLTKRLRNSTPP